MLGNSFIIINFEKSICLTSNFRFNHLIFINFIIYRYFLYKSFFIISFFCSFNIDISLSLFFIVFSKLILFSFNKDIFSFNLLFSFLSFFNLIFEFVLLLNMFLLVFLNFEYLFKLILPILYLEIKLLHIIDFSIFSVFLNLVLLLY